MSAFERGIGVAMASWLTLAGCRTAAAQGAAAGAREHGAAHARVAFAHALPRLDGGRVEAMLIEVAYGPGGSSQPHSHPCAVIGYVIEGVLRTQVKGEPEAVYHAGESFYEAPNGVHQVSANGSATEPVRFLAYFTCDRKTPLSVALPDSGKRP